MKARAIVVLGLAASLWMSGYPASAAKRKPSTPKERARAVKLVRSLEEKPYDPAAREARRWLSLWLVEVPDVPVDLCPELFGGTAAERRRVPPEVVAQTVYSGAAFVIENPDKADAREEVYQAGMLGALKAYEAMLAERPGLRSPLLDGLVGKREAGTLPAHVAESMARCPAVKPVSSN